MFQTLFELYFAGKLDFDGDVLDILRDHRYEFVAFRFNVEQRNEESGLLSAVGVRSRQVLRWRLLEGDAVTGALGLEYRQLRYTEAGGADDYDAQLVFLYWRTSW